MPKRRNSKRNRAGGTHSANPSAYSDAASYALATAGNSNTQYSNVFDIGKNNQQGNGLVGLQGQRVGGGRSRGRGRSQGRSRGRKRSRSQKGGFWGGLISNALAPFSLLAMQQSFKRKNNGNQTRRRS
jgi:hypothetical protein